MSTRTAQNETPVGFEDMQIQVETANPTRSESRLSIAYRSSIRAEMQNDA